MRINATQTRNRDRVAITYDEKLREQEREQRFTFKGVVGSIGLVIYIIALVNILGA